MRHTLTDQHGTCAENFGENFDGAKLDEDHFGEEIADPDS